ncbi:Secreted protein OS=Streptomyces microflavus OX=1919 GN=HUT09_18740 PE=4 SV=1 [Streptomyces microflavus]
MLLTVLPFVLVLAAVGGAAAYTVRTVDGADRTVTTVVWDGSGPKPGLDPAAKADRGRTDTELSRLPMPVPEGYRLGPHIGELGTTARPAARRPPPP